MVRQWVSDDNSNIRSDYSLVISVGLYANGEPLGLPSRTRFSQHAVNSYRWVQLCSGSCRRWDEVIEFPVRYKDIPLSTQIVLTIHDIILPNKKVFVGGTTLPLFGRKGKLKTGVHHTGNSLTHELGRQKLIVWPGQEGDGSVNTSTPGKPAHTTNPMDEIEKVTRWALKSWERTNKATITTTKVNNLMLFS